MQITARFLDSYAARILGSFHSAAERHGSPVPHPFVVRSDNVAYGIGYASQMLEQDGRSDLAWRALMDAAEDTDRQLEEFGWLFNVEEVEGLRIVSSEIRQVVAENARPGVPTEAAAPV